MLSLPSCSSLWDGAVCPSPACSLELRPPAHLPPHTHTPPCRGHFAPPRTGTGPGTDRRSAWYSRYAHAEPLKLGEHRGRRRGRRRHRPPRASRPVLDPVPPLPAPELKSQGTVGLPLPKAQHPFIPPPPPAFVHTPMSLVRPPLLPRTSGQILANTHCTVSHFELSVVPPFVAGALGPARVSRQGAKSDSQRGAQQQQAGGAGGIFDGMCAKRRMEPARALCRRPRPAPLHDRGRAKTSAHARHSSPHAVRRASTRGGGPTFKRRPGSVHPGARSRHRSPREGGGARRLPRARRHQWAMALGERGHGGVSGVPCAYIRSSKSRSGWRSMRSYAVAMEEGSTL